MADLPTLHITNWSSTKLHGPGRKLTIMARPRAWEHGEGRVPACTPLAGWLEAIRSRSIDIDTYRCWIEERLAEHELAPGGLVAISGGSFVPVVDGDTLCCACSRGAAGRHECHRVWVAAALARAGWRVILDGVEVVDAA